MTQPRHSKTPAASGATDSEIYGSPLNHTCYILADTYRARLKVRDQQHQGPIPKEYLRAQTFIFGFINLFAMLVFYYFILIK